MLSKLLLLLLAITITIMFTIAVATGSFNIIVPSALLFIATITNTFTFCCYCCCCCYYYHHYYYYYYYHYYYHHHYFCYCYNYVVFYFCRSQFYSYRYFLFVTLTFMRPRSAPPKVLASHPSSISPKPLPLLSTKKPYPAPPAQTARPLKGSRKRNLQFIR